jgi:hypothetical protein
MVNVQLRTSSTRAFFLLLLAGAIVSLIASCGDQVGPVVTASDPSYSISAGTFAVGSIISGDDPVHGPGSLTIDTNSGLEWLELTLSTNLSPDFVSTQLGQGGLFEGFRYATIAELTALFENAGIPNITFGPGTLTSANFEPVSSLMALIGTTVTTPEVLQTFGFLGEPSPFVPENLAVGVLQAFVVTQVGSADPVQSSNPSSSQFETVGHFLVRAIAKAPAELIEDLIDDIQALAGVELNPGQINGLTTPLMNALRSIERGKIAPACSQLQDFISEVITKTPPLSAESSAALIAAAQAIRDDLDCPD